jgi:hypothetical protein
MDLPEGRPPVTEKETRNLEPPLSAVAGITESRIIRREGASWIIQYEDERGVFPVEGFTALEIVAKLVVRPKQPLELKDLVDVDARIVGETTGSTADVLDDTAIAGLRQRFYDLQRDPGDGESPGEQAERAEEISAIAAELKKHLGPGGRKRKLGHTSQDRAWDALTKNLRRLWVRLGQAKMPKLADHLEATIEFNRPQVTYNSGQIGIRWGTGD